MKTRPSRALVIASAVFVLVLGSLVQVVQRGRAAVAHGTFDAGGRADRAGHVFFGIRVQTMGLIFVGCVVLAALGVALFLAARQKAGPGMAATLLSTCWLLPLVPAAAGVLVYGMRVSHDFMGVVAVAPSMKAAWLHAALPASAFALSVARVGVLVSVVAGAIAAVVQARRGQDAFIPPVLAGVLLGVGVLAFVLTRGHAADRAPLPILPGAMDAALAGELPAAPRCLTGPMRAPVLRFTKDAAHFESARVSPAKFRERWLVSRNNRALLAPGNENGPLLAVVARPDTPMSAILPYLARIEAGEVHLAAAIPRPFPSRTRGTIERVEYCGRPFRLVEEGAPLGGFATWGALSAAMDRSDAVLALAPR